MVIKVMAVREIHQPYLVHDDGKPEKNLPCCH